MFTIFKNNLKADFIILYKNNAVRNSLLVGLVILSYIFYVASQNYNPSSTSYYFDQACILVSIVNVYIVIILGALLGSIDWNCKTFCVRIINTSRMLMSVSRIILLLLFSIALVCFHLLIGAIMDLLHGSTYFSLNELKKMCCIVLILMFWSVSSYLISLITKSFSITASIGIGYILIESYVDRFLPSNVLKMLPIWNQKNILKSIFPVQEGAVAIVQAKFGNPSLSLLIIILFILIVIGMVFTIENKKQY